MPPKILLILKSVIPTGALALFSRHKGTLVGKFAKLPIQNSEEFEVGNGKNYLHPKKSLVFFSRSVKILVRMVNFDNIFWDLALGSELLRQDSEMTLPRGSVSDLPFSLKKSWELVCLRTARSLLQTLPRRLSQNPSSDRSRSQFLQ